LAAFTITAPSASVPLVASAIERVVQDLRHVQLAGELHVAKVLYHPLDRGSD